ncbi:MAG: hypothetical protein ACK2UI_01655 [Anaerolineae bacterium]|jgi:hypothetical protein
MTVKMNITLGAFVSTIALITSVAQAAPPEKDVNVVNTPDVNVVNTPNVNASIVNEPTVHVGSSVDVNSYQAGEWFVNVDNGAKAIKTFTGQLQSTDGWVEVYQVPSGKRLVLTDIYFNQGTYGDYLNAVSLNRNSSADACGIGSNFLMKMHVRGLDGHDINYVFFPLQTGYEFVEGERICVAQSGGGLIFYNLSGYETDM